MLSGQFVVCSVLCKCVFLACRVQYVVWSVSCTICNNQCIKFHVYCTVCSVGVLLSMYYEQAIYRVNLGLGIWFVVLGASWWFLVILGGPWWFLVVFGGFWWFLVVLGGYW